MLQRVGWAVARGRGLMPRSLSVSSTILDDNDDFKSSMDELFGSGFGNMKFKKHIEKKLEDKEKKFLAKQKATEVKKMVKEPTPKSKELYIAQKQIAEHPKVQPYLAKDPDFESIWPDYYRTGWFTSEMVTNLPVTAQNGVYFKRMFSGYNSSKVEMYKTCVRQLVDLLKRKDGDCGNSEVQSMLFCLSVCIFFLILSFSCDLLVEYRLC
jgi:hypothetical protein